MSTSVLSKHPIIGVVVILACIGGSIAALTLRGNGQQQEFENAYYLDLNSSKVFIAQGPNSPIKAPSGSMPDGSPAGFLAYVFTCGQAFNADGLTIEAIKAKGGGVAFVSRYSQEAMDAQRQLTGGNFADNDPRLYELATKAREGHSVRSPSGGEWVQADTAQAHELLISATSVCSTSGKTRRLVPEGSRTLE